jgi:cysteine desulfurase/selenocysteine lyase
MKHSTRTDFPILQQKVNGHPLIYFDNASTSQKPQQVIDAISNFYANQNSNIGRGIYQISENATILYEKARAAVAHYLNAQPEEIIFTKGATEGINFIATAWALKSLEQGDEILLTEMEHHSNLIPWQQVAHAKKAKLKFIPVLSNGMLDLSQLDALITNKTKIVSIVHVSNALGTHNDIATIIKAAKSVSALTCIDAAQSIGHQKIDIKKIGCDFLVFSGHKIFGPTGIGILYINKKLHEKIDPYQFGGGMIYEADFQNATFQKAPQKFEAGTPAIAQAIGLHAAISYINEHINFNELQTEANLCAALIDGLSKFKKIKLLGPLDQLKEKGHLVSFIVDGMHAHDVAAYLNNYGICVRAGNHCAQPLLKKMGINATVRASFHAYNTLEEVEIFLEVIKDIL